jgi:hypothetical protein
MTKTDETSTLGAQTERQDQPWKQLWPKVKTPLQLIITQLIGWALRKWLG